MTSSSSFYTSKFIGSNMLHEETVRIAYVSHNTCQNHMVKKYVSRVLLTQNSMQVSFEQLEGRKCPQFQTHVGPHILAYKSNGK